MAMLSRKLRSVETSDGTRKGLIYWCQGCESLHQIWYVGGDPGRNWTWNGDIEKPTFTPSVLSSWDTPQGKQVCHSFVTNGMVQFLPDCTHKYAGRTEPLPDLPDYMQK